MSQPLTVNWNTGPIGPGWLIMFAPTSSTRRHDLFHKHAVPLRERVEEIMPVGVEKLREQEDAIMIALLLAAEC